MPSSIALLTDFGLRDTYVAAMKAVILAKLPSVTLLDLTHDISPGDVNHAAFEAWRIQPYLPEGSILLAVVDPGVGTSRRPIALKLPGCVCVGPDNGLFSYLLEPQDPVACVEIDPRALGLAQISSTFHGRDLFSPAAVMLAGGGSIEDLGPSISNITRLSPPHLRIPPGGPIQGEILHIDRYGNLITSIGYLQRTPGQLQLKPWLSERAGFVFSSEQVRIELEHASPFSLVETFGDVPAGSALAYIGSAGLLEIAVRDGNAALTLQAKRGDPVVMTLS